MIRVLGRKYLDPAEVATALSVTTRTLNRWASNPEGSPPRARELSPVTLINGRRVYPAENVLSILKETFGNEMTVDELEGRLNFEHVQMTGIRASQAPAASKIRLRLRAKRRPRVFSYDRGSSVSSRVRSFEGKPGAKSE